MVDDVLTVSSECPIETHANSVIQGQTSFPLCNLFRAIGNQTLQRDVDSED